MDDLDEVDERGRAAPVAGDGARHTRPQPGPEPPTPTAEASRRPPTRPIGDSTEPTALVRLQKLLAQSGVASRRKCEELMLEGQVEVDGEVVTRLGTKVDPRTAVIRVDGKRLPPVSAHVYLVLNKPRGVVSHHVGPARVAGRSPTSWRTGPSGSSTSAGSTPTPRA